MPRQGGIPRWGSLKNTEKREVHELHAVETRGLTKDYSVGSLFQKKRRALDALDLEVEEGEIFGLIGPNGAGKTTTLKLLMGLIFPTGGEARVLGRSLGDAEMKQEVGYLPEQPYFYDYLTGRELLNYFGQLFGLSREERNRRSAELLDTVGMTEAADVPLRKYSKGMMQRLGIAQALVNRPRLVLLDEPMSGLDPIGRREMSHLVRELRDSGVTVLFCSHILPDVEQLCDRVAILHRGKLVESGRLTEIVDVSLQAIEVVVEGLSPELESKLAGKIRSSRRLGTRSHLSFADTSGFESALPTLLENGVRLVSMTPVKETLEDHFVRQVTSDGGGK
jgi:ABC-2 type transport system ATP-binding protein